MVSKRTNKRRRGGQERGTAYGLPSEIRAANAAAKQDKFDEAVDRNLLPGDNGSFSGSNPMHRGKGGKSRRRNKKSRNSKSKRRR